MDYTTKISDREDPDRINQDRSKSNVPQFCLSYISDIFGLNLIKFGSQRSLRPTNIMSAHVENLRQGH